jgi:hypothetical protein
MSTGGFFPEIKQPRHEVDQLPPSRAKVKNVWTYISTSPHVPWHEQGRFTFYFTSVQTITTDLNIKKLPCIIITNHLQRGKDPTSAALCITNIQAPLKW